MKQGEGGVPVAEICQKTGISQTTYFNWRKKYAGLMPSEMKRLRELEEENSRLKKIVAGDCQESCAGGVLKAKTLYIGETDRSRSERSRRTARLGRTAATNLSTGNCATNV